MYPHCADILLQDILDYVSMEDLLLAAMPVSRLWRQQAVSHPTYWRDIYLWDTRYAPSAPKYTSSLSLFLLRLSRSREKFIEVSCAVDDPDAVLGAIALHLSHIRRLSVTARPAQAVTIFAALRDAKADALESLALDFMESGLADSVVRLPPELFAGQAGALRELVLHSVSLPICSVLPVWMNRITSLSVTSYAPGYFTLSTVLALCPRLSALRVCGNIALDDAAFGFGSSFARLGALELSGGRPEDHWGFLDQALAVVPRILITDADAVSVVVLADLLGTRLAAAVHRYETCTAPDDVPSPVCVALRDSADVSGRRRWLDTPIPPGPWHFPHHAMSGFQHARVADRIVQLVLALDNWRGLVGPGHLTRFAGLEELVLTISAEDQPASLTPPASATLSCPRLDRLVLRRYRWSGPPVVDLDDLAKFAAAALPDAPFPLALEINDVTVARPEAELPSQFRACLFADMKEPEWNF